MHPGSLSVTCKVDYWLQNLHIKPKNRYYKRFLLGPKKKKKNLCQSSPQELEEGQCTVTAVLKNFVFDRIYQDTRTKAWPCLPASLQFSWPYLLVTVKYIFQRLVCDHGGRTPWGWGADQETDQWSEQAEVSHLIPYIRGGGGTYTTFFKLDYFYNWS